MLTDFFEDFRHVTVERTADGMGGSKPAYTDGERFLAGIGTLKRKETDVAGRDAEKNQYAVLAEKGTVLKMNDIIRRVATGVYYRVTSDSSDMDTPPNAGVQFTQVTAEVIRV